MTQSLNLCRAQLQIDLYLSLYAGHTEKITLRRLFFSEKNKYDARPPFFPTRWDGLLRLKIYICTYEANHDRSEAFYTKASLWFRFEKGKIKNGKIRNRPFRLKTD